MNWLLAYRWSDLPRLAGLALVYVLLAKIALSFFSVNGIVSVIWPSGGLALAAMLIGGKKYWPVAFVGSLTAGIVAGNPVGVSAVVALGSTLEGLIGFWLLAPGNRFDPALSLPRNYIWLIGAAAIGACVSALIGVTTLWLTGALAPQDITTNLLHWWQGDVFGIAVVTPLILIWRQLPQGWFGRGRVLETVACFGLAFLVGQVIFLDWFHDSFGHVILDDWMFVFVIWSALRFGRHGVLLVVAMTATQALLSVVKETGVFATDLAQTGLLNFWVYMLLIMAVGMSLALSIARSKLITEILRTSEERLKIAADSGQIGVWEYSPQTHELVWDDTMLALYGTRREDFSGTYDAWVERLHPEDRAVAEAALQDVIAGKRQSEPEFRIIWPDGEVHYIKGHAQAINNQDGKPIRIIGSSWDNREYIYTQQRLQLAHAAINKSGSAFFWLNSKGRLVDVNDHACQNFGQSREELLSRHIWDFDSNLLAKSWPDFWTALKVTGTYSFEANYRRKDGTAFPAEVVANYVYSQGEEYSFTFVQDITERKHAEQAIINSDQRFKDIVNTTDGIVWEAAAATFDFTFVSQQAERLLGYPVEDWLKPGFWAEHLHPDDKSWVVEFCASCTAQGERHDFEYRFIALDGRTVWLRDIVTVVVENGIPLWLRGVMVDITQRKQTEMVLAESEWRLRFLDEFSDATRTLAEPEEIMVTATRLLGTHLHASRCAYAEVETDGDHFIIPHDYTDGCASTVGDYRLALFGPRAVSELQAGRTYVVNDVDADLSPDKGREMFNAIAIKAIICCPLIKQGVLRAMMAVHQTVARTWTPSEISLVEEVVERCWAIIERARAEKERNQIEDELLIAQTAIEKSKSAFFRLSSVGEILYVNDYACQSLGYTREELLAMKVWEFDPDFPAEAWAPMWEGLRKDRVVHIETRHRRKDGSIFPVEVVGNVIDSREGEFSFTFVQDITERKQSEQRIQRLSQLYKALSETNEAIVRMEKQSELFPLVCRCAVEFGGMKLAWIGRLEEATGSIELVASHGNAANYLKNLHVSSHVDVPEGRGTTGTALRENRAIIVNDYLDNPMTKPWSAQARKYGWASAAAFPIQRGGQPFAVLTVCHAEAGAFDDEVIELLTEMSKDISFALDNFDREVQRVAATESLRLAASVYETSSEGIMITNATNDIIAINPAFTTITGYTLEEVLGKNPSILKSGQHDETFYQAMWEEINNTGYWQGEVWDKRKNGETYPKWLTINTVFDEDGVVQRRVAMFTDISRKREAEEMIWRQANFDTLTDLPNRQMFYDRLDQDIKKAHRANHPLALMLLDLDRFKEVNDTLGHDMGDVLLKEVAQRLSNCVRESDTVARLGGDEFTILLGDLVDPSSVERVAQDVLQKMAQPFHLKGEVAYISASIGITLYPEDATEIEVLLKNADQAMYASKNQGRNRYSYFTPSMQQAVQTRMRIANDLRNALTNDEFWIAYQPIVELATGSIHKAEALIRWQHPKHGLISPATFIPIAEDTGLIVEIGDWVFHEAAKQAKRWRKSLHPEFQISINKSPVQFQSEAHTGVAWYKYLQKLDLPGQSIAVEITEGLLLEASSKVSDRLLEFRDAGIQVAIDDFGTGYSALSYLKRFDIDYLKIDQSFTRNLAPGSEDMALCEAMIVMANKLGIKVIAEGVETEAQKDLLTAVGCDYAQGYLFSRPIPAKELELLLSH